MTEWMAGQAGTIGRTVESREWRGQPARAVVVARSYPTNVEDLWRAITDPGRLARWFMPVTGDLELGGRYQLQGNAGGTIDRCEPPRLLGVTWEFGGNTSWVNVTLDREGDGARLTLEHIAFEDAAGLAFWDQFGPGAVGVGWDLALLGLTAHLAGEILGTGNPADLETDPSMRDCMTASSGEWGEAYRASGIDDETAKRATEATTQFYVPPA